MPSLKIPTRNLGLGKRGKVAGLGLVATLRAYFDTTALSNCNPILSLTRSLSLLMYNSLLLFNSLQFLCAHPGLMEKILSKGDKLYSLEWSAWSLILETDRSTICFLKPISTWPRWHYWECAIKPVFISGVSSGSGNTMYSKKSPKPCWTLWLKFVIYSVSKNMIWGFRKFWTFFI